MDDKDISIQSAEPQPIQYDLNKKRPDYIEWPDYFMAIAFLSAQRSKDPGSQVGACIVNRDKKIVGIGYNGMPNGCNDDELPWCRTADNRLDTKYPYVCHAEMNAIMNKNSADLKDCIMYVALFPCNECAKLIIQAGIKEIIYVSDKYHEKPEMVASRRLLDLAGVIYKKFEPKRKRLVIDFDVIDRVLVQIQSPIVNLSKDVIPDRKVYKPDQESKNLTKIDAEKSAKTPRDILNIEMGDVSSDPSFQKTTKRTAEEAGLDSQSAEHNGKV